MTIDDIKDLIKIDETRTVELKKTTGELKDGMHSLCAMLNSDGGYVIFGIAPKTLKIIGQMVSDKTRQEIAWELRKIEPCVNVAVEYVTVPDTDGQQVVVLHADKEKFNNAVLLGSLGKGFDIRVGDFDIGNAGAVTHKLFQRLFATVGRIPFLAVKLHELSQCCLQHLSVQLCRLNCKCNGLTCNFFLQNVPPFAALQVPL